MKSSNSSEPMGDASPMPIREQFASAIESMREQMVNETMRTDEANGIRNLLQTANTLVLRYTNSQRGINRLPPEILRLVFTQAARTTDFVSITSGAVKDVGWVHSHIRTRDVLALSHVCHQWREVSLCFPDLWTSIRDLHSAEAKEFLSRAKDRSLTALILAEHRQTWFWDLCMECGPSIHELHWVSPKNNKGSFTSIPALDIKAPNVQRLSLSKSAGDQAVYSGGSILRGATTQVKLLSLNNIDWLPSNRFPVLTRVVLTGQRLLLNSLITFLAHCPALDTLLLRDCSAIPLLHVPGNVMQHVTIPRLRRLSLGMRNDRLDDILSVLHFDQPRTAVEIVIHTQRDAIPTSLVIPIFDSSKYFESPLTRLYLRQSDGTPGSESSIAAVNDVGGICFKSPSPFPSPHSFIFSRNIALSTVTEFWMEGADMALFAFYTVFRREMCALQTLAFVFPERTPDPETSFHTFVSTIRLPQTIRVFPYPVPTLRVVLGNGAHWDKERDPGTYGVLRALCQLPPPEADESKVQLVIRAHEFSTEFHEVVLPRLKDVWESVELEESVAGETPIEMPPATMADPELSAWTGWL